MAVFPSCFGFISVCFFKVNYSFLDIIFLVVSPVCMLFLCGSSCRSHLQ